MRADMCTRTSYYLAIFSLMNALGRHREACKLLWVQASGGSCAADLVQSMQQSATQYAKVGGALRGARLEAERNAANPAPMHAAGLRKERFLSSPWTALSLITLSSALKLALSCIPPPPCLRPLDFLRRRRSRSQCLSGR
jgi:hypothetical protein